MFSMLGHMVSKLCLSVFRLVREASVRPDGSDVSMLAQWAPNDFNTGEGGGFNDVLAGGVHCQP